MKKELNLGVLFTGKVDATFLNAIKNIQSKLDALDNSSKRAAAGTSQFTQSLTKSVPVLGQYLAQLEKILKAQAVWYGSKAILFAAVELPKAGVTSVAEYALELDKARSEMLRWGATSGTVTKKMEADVDGMMMGIRRAMLQFPLDFQDFSKSIQAFIGAGVPVKTVEQMIPMIAKMKTAFKEIDFEQFAVAVTGAFNTFRDQIKLGTNDAEKFQIVMEQLLRAQAVGVIRPEQFTKVLQYLGQVSNLAGFTTEQMFAMATAITNTGNQASNASRLMAGLLQAMSGPKFRKALEGDLGLKLDRNVSLAKQFDQIMTTIITKMGKGEPVPLGWLEWVSGVTSADRSKVFMTFIQQYETFVKLTKDIAGASGGLEAASKVMQMPISKQWTVFVNTLKEIGLALGGDLDKKLRGFVNVVLDIAQGFLAALDNGKNFPFLLDNLGAAGKRTYDVVSLLKIEFGILWDTLKAGLGIIVKVLEVFAKIPGGIELIVTAILVRLVAGALTPLMLALRSFVAYLWSNLFSGLAMTAVSFGTTAPSAMLVFRTALMGLLTPINIVTVALTGLLYLLGQAWAESERLANQAANTQERLRSGSIAEIEADLKAKRLQLLKVEKANPDVEVEGFVTNRAEKEINQLKEEISLLEKRKEFLQEQEAFEDRGGETKKGEPPPPEKTKDSSAAIISAKKAELNALLGMLKAFYDEDKAYLENANKLKLVDERTYYQKKYDYAAAEAALETALIRETQKEINDEYNKAIGAARGDKKKVGAAEEKRQRDQAQLDLKIFQRDSKVRIAADNLVTSNLELNKNLRIAQTAHEQKMEELRISNMVEHTKYGLDQIQKDTDDRYANNRMTMYEYYDTQKWLVDANEGMEAEALSRQWKAYEKAFADRRKEAGQSVIENDKLDKEWTEKFEENENKRLAIHLKASDKHLDIERRLRNEYQYIWDKEGPWGIIKKKMEEMYGKSDKPVQDFAKMIEDTFKNLETSLESVFFDALEGRCKSFADYWKDFAKLLRATLAKYLAAETMTWLFGSPASSGGTAMGGLMGLGGGILNSLTGGGFNSLVSQWDIASLGGNDAVLGMLHKGGIAGEGNYSGFKTVSPYILANMPRFHRGMNNDEVAAILKKRETVLTEEDVSAIKSGLSRPGYSYNVGPIVVSESEEKRNRRLRSEIDKTVRRVLREAT